MTMRTTLVLAAALAVPALLAPAAAEGVLPRRAFIQGDSLGEGTAPYLESSLPRWRLREDVDVSRHVQEGVDLIRAQGSALEPVVVVQLGTNDDPRFVSGFRGLVDEALAAAGPGRCMIWVNIVRPPAVGASYDGYNRVLADTAARNANFRVVDWVRLVRLHPWWLAPDGVHVSIGGYRARARAIAGAMSQCRRSM